MRYLILFLWVTSLFCGTCFAAEDSEKGITDDEKVELKGLAAAEDKEFTEALQGYLNLVTIAEQGEDTSAEYLSQLGLHVSSTKVAMGEQDFIEKWQQWFADVTGNHVPFADRIKSVRQGMTYYIGGQNPDLFNRYVQILTRIYLDNPELRKPLRQVFFELKTYSDFDQKQVEMLQPGKVFLDRLLVALPIIIAVKSTSGFLRPSNLRQMFLVRRSMSELYKAQLAGQTRAINKAAARLKEVLLNMPNNRKLVERLEQELEKARKNGKMPEKLVRKVQLDLKKVSGPGTVQKSMFEKVRGALTSKEMIMASSYSGAMALSAMYRLSAQAIRHNPVEILYLTEINRLHEISEELTAIENTHQVPAANGSIVKSSANPELPASTTGSKVLDHLQTLAEDLMQLSNAAGEDADLSERLGKNFKTAAKELLQRAIEIGKKHLPAESALGDEGENEDGNEDNENDQD